MTELTEHREDLEDDEHLRAISVLDGSRSQLAHEEIGVRRSPELLCQVLGQKGEQRVLCAHVDQRRFYDSSSQRTLLVRTLLRAHLANGCPCLSHSSAGKSQLSQTFLLRLVSAAALASAFFSCASVPPAPPTNFSALACCSSAPSSVRLRWMRGGSAVMASSSGREMAVPGREAFDGERTKKGRLPRKVSLIVCRRRLPTFRRASSRAASRRDSVAVRTCAVDGYARE